MMVAPLQLIVVAFVAALRWHPANGQLARSMTTVSDFVCSTGSEHYNVAAHYGVWRSVRTRVASPTFTGECIVNVSLATHSEQQQPRRPQLLLLVKIEQLWLGKNGEKNYFFVVSEMTARTSVRRTHDFCIAAFCGPTYLWANESVTLYLYIGSVSVSNVSYDASFVVTKATNVCGLLNFSGELLVRSDGSSEYAFASNSWHNKLPPNDVECTCDSEYSLTVLSSVASALLTVTVLACPSSSGCGTLKLNGQNCTDDARVVSAPPGSNVTLRYVLGSRNCDARKEKYAGFVVSARVIASTETPSTLLVVAVSVAAALAAALVIGITIALLRRRQRSPSRKSPSSAVHYARSSASAGDEEIAMVSNDLYGVPLASTTTTDQ